MDGVDERCAAADDAPGGATAARPTVDGRVGAGDWPGVGAAARTGGAIDAADGRRGAGCDSTGVPVVRGIGVAVRATEIAGDDGGTIVAPALRGCGVAVRATEIAGDDGGTIVEAEGGRGAGAMVPCDGRRGSITGDDAGFTGVVTADALMGIDGVGLATTGDKVVPRVRSLVVAGVVVDAGAGLLELPADEFAAIASNAARIAKNTSLAKRTVSALMRANLVG